MKLLRLVTLKESDSIINNRNELLALREGLRMSLLYGRSIFSLTKKDLKEGNKKDKKIKNRKKKKILTLFSKYPLLHSKSN